MNLFVEMLLYMWGATTLLIAVLTLAFVLKDLTKRKDDDTN